MRFWFFGGGGATFIASAECSTEEGARRMVVHYNRQPGSLGPIDLITDHQVPDQASVRLTVAKPPDKPESEDE